MEELRQIQNEYPAKDSYNMDDTEICWKFISDGSPTTEIQSGQTKDKLRLTVVHTCNADGSVKMKPWAINNAYSPWCFGRQNIAIRG